MLFRQYDRGIYLKVSHRCAASIPKVSESQGNTHSRHVPEAGMMQNLCGGWCMAIPARCLSRGVYEEGRVGSTGEGMTLSLRLGSRRLFPLCYRSFLPLLLLSLEKHRSLLPRSRPLHVLLPSQCDRFRG